MSKSIEMEWYSLFYQKRDADDHAITAFFSKIALEAKVTKACRFTPI